jgi:hypothetical protein
MSLLELLIVILILAWLLGYFVFPLGNLVHLLLVVLLIVIIVRVVQGRRPLP